MILIRNISHELDQVLGTNQMHAILQQKLMAQELDTIVSIDTTYFTYQDNLLYISTILRVELPLRPREALLYLRISHLAEKARQSPVSIKNQQPT